MFTVEIDQADDAIEIHLDAAGLAVLERSLARLRRAGAGHDHLMTPSWAGTELTEVPQGRDTRLVHMVTHVLKP